MYTNWAEKRIVLYNMPGDLVVGKVHTRIPMMPGIGLGVLGGSCDV